MFAVIARGLHVGFGVPDGGVRIWIQRRRTGETGTPGIPAGRSVLGQGRLRGGHPAARPDHPGCRAGRAARAGVSDRRPVWMVSLVVTALASSRAQLAMGAS